MELQRDFALDGIANLIEGFFPWYTQLAFFGCQKAHKTISLEKEECPKSKDSQNQNEI